MPGRGLGRTRLLDQHMVVEELHPLGCHQAGCRLCQRRVTNNGLKLRYARPVAIVIKEATTLARLQILCSVLTSVYDGMASREFRQDKPITELVVV